MYRIDLRGKRQAPRAGSAAARSVAQKRAAGGALDIGAPAGRSCLECANIRGPDVTINGYSYSGYFCDRFVTLIEGEPISCGAARASHLICGQNAQGFEPNAATKFDSSIADDRRAGSGGCSNCAHVVYDTLTHGLGCARLASATDGAPTDCRVARASTSLCGPGGAWFVPRAPEPEDDLRAPSVGEPYNGKW